MGANAKRFCDTGYGGIVDAKGENLVVHHALIILGQGNLVGVFDLINLKTLFALW